MPDDSARDDATGAANDDHIPFDDLGVSGLLTRADREYLIGEKTYDDPVQERKTRARLRERVRNGLRDFELLAHYLDDRDLEQIFHHTTAGRKDPQRTERDEVLRGMKYAIAFFFAGTEDVDEPFDHLLEGALLEATKTMFDDPFTVRGFRVTIERNEYEDTRRAFYKLRAGEELSDLEYRGLRGLLFSDLDVFLDRTSWFDIDRERRLEDGERFSRGESLIVLARAFDRSGILEPELDKRLLHHEVLEDFGIDQFIR